MTASRIGQAVLVVFFVCALVLPYIGGAPLALVSAILILIMAGWQLTQRWQPDFDPGAAMLLAAFSLLAVAFAITNRPGTVDVVYVFNFTLLALYSPLSNLLSRFASPMNSRRVGWLAFAGVALAFAIALVQVFLLDYRRAAGWGSNPIPSSTVALLLGFVALVGFFSEQSPRRYVFLAGPLLGIGTVLLSGSRGPLLAIPVLALIAAVLLPIRKVVLLGILVGALMAGGLFLTLKPDMLDRILVIGQAAGEIVAGETVDADRSTGIRSQIYAASVTAFLDSPWIGHGWGGRVAAVARYLDEIFSVHDQRSHLHSDILDFAVAAGAVGLIAYALTVLAPVASSLSAPRDSQFRERLYGTLILCAGYLACGTVNKLLGHEYMTTFFIATAAILSGYCRDAPVGRVTRRD